MNNYEKLIRVLKEIFQLDQADLDFGIYRIMNQKRDEIEKFLTKDLLPQVRKSFEQYTSHDKSALQQELDKTIENAKGMGIDPETVPKVKELRDKMHGATDVVALENEVFSLLANFFRRYYKDGDFISMRRYKKDVYAIPYEGEEVKLHWANHDQYYIKSSEYFKNYSFKLSDDKKVTFELIEADTEQNNNKAQEGKERRFAVAKDKPVKEENGELKIFFTYEINSEKQDKLLEEAFSKIKMKIPQSYYDLLSLRPTEKNKNRTLLEKHLKDYTARNTFDYFIHKDLGGFLNRELDFYIKNEVLFIDDINTRDEAEFTKQLSKIKALKEVAQKIIAFLEQLENFQKKLWLKKKFVVETNYCITLDRVPEELYTDIITNKEQTDEWIKLFSIDEIRENKKEQAKLFDGDNIVPFTNPLTIEFLKANPYLVLDTAFFSDEFKTKLLASINNIDEQLDGLLIHSENFQGINLLSNRFKEQIKSVHIDPPYNTATSGFLYKNNYQHSSWVAMMENRVFQAERLIAENGTFQTHIDENEYENLFQIFKQTNLTNAGTIIWDKRNPMNGGSGVANQHEYVVCFNKGIFPVYRRNKTILEMLGKAKELIKKEGGVSENVKKSFATWVNSNKELSGGEKAYRYLDNEGRIYQSVSLRAPEPRQDSKFHQPLLHPTTKKPCAMPPNGFSRTPETLSEMVKRGEILFGEDETTQPRQKAFLTEESKRQLSSLLQDAKKGKAFTDQLGVEFPYCHPVSLYEELIGISSLEKDEIMLDFFAGSGTSGHAVVNLNRDDEGKRKYILIEMGEYFDNVTKPRIQKVVYSKDWKDGKPVSREGISHCFKYIRLESYEDTLNNLELKRSKDQGAALLQSEHFGEEYLLSYMLDVETDGSASLLNTEWFTNPFDYKLKITRKNETKTIKVDLPETFNYLIGLVVETIDEMQGFKVITGKNLQDEKILVIWRNTVEKDNKTLDKFFLKQQYNTRDNEFDRIYVNGDNNLENLKIGDEKWKVVLIEEEFKKRMFDVKEF